MYRWIARTVRQSGRRLPAGARNKRRTFRPQLEALEDRRLMAQSAVFLGGLLSGSVLTETFDDVMPFSGQAVRTIANIPVYNSLPRNDQAGIGSLVYIFDDPLATIQPDPSGQGTVTTYDLNHILFRHSIVGSAYLGVHDGTTTPIASDQDPLALELVSGATDLIVFPDVNNATESVRILNIDVRQGAGSSVAVIGRFDTETLYADPAGSSGTTGPSVHLGVYYPNSPPNTVANSAVTFPPSLRGDPWVRLGATASDIGIKGLPLGPIRGLILTVPVSYSTYYGYNYGNYYSPTVGSFDNLRIFVSALPPNSPPVAGDVPGGTVDANSTNNNINVLPYVGDPDGDPVSLPTLQYNSMHGGVVQQSGQSLLYTPPFGYVGPDSFKYTVQDIYGNTATGTVSVLVNTAPTAPNLTIMLTHGQAGPYSGQTGATDPDGDPLTFAIQQNGRYGSATVNADGSFTYVPDGPAIYADSFTYQVSDPFTSRFGTVTFVPDNQPLADPVDDLVPIGHLYRGPKMIDVLANDPYPHNGSDPVGPFGDPLQLQIVQQPALGEVHINPDNTITYTPHQRTLQPDGTILYSLAPDPNGLVLDDTFTYALFDPIEGLLSNTATVHLVPANHAPVAQDLHLSNLGSPGSPVPDINLLAQGSDADNDPLQALYSADNGTLQLQTNGLYTFVPSNDHVVHAQIHFRLTDGYTESNAATVFLDWDHQPAQAGDEHFFVDIYNSYVNNDIHNENDFTDAEQTILKDPHLQLGPNLLLADPNDAIFYNFADPQDPGRGNPAFPPGVPLDSQLQPVTIRIVDQPTRGNLTVNPDGTFTYSPYVFADGTLVLRDGLRTDSFTYVLNDGYEDSNIATVTLTPRRRELIVRSDVTSFASDLLSNNLVLNDSFPDGTSVLPRQDLQILSVIGHPTGGSFTLTGGPLGSNTVTVDWNADAGQLLQALTSVVGLGNVSCLGGPLPDNPIQITWAGRLGDRPEDVLVVASNNLAGGTYPAPVVTHRTVGSPGNYLVGLVLRSDPTTVPPSPGPYLLDIPVAANMPARKGDVFSTDGVFSYSFPTYTRSNDTFYYSVRYRANDDPNAQVLDTYVPGDRVKLDEGVARVEVSTHNGPADTDGDLVPDAVENQAYQGTDHVGDGNLDGIPDVQQVNVVTLPNGVDGQDVTLVAGATSPKQPLPEFAKVEANARTAGFPDGTPATLPDGVSAPIGFFHFELLGTGQGVGPSGVDYEDSTTVTLWMPPGVVPSGFYILHRGAFEDFPYNPATGEGAEILPPGPDPSTGRPLPARVVLHLQVPGVAADEQPEFEGAPVTGSVPVALTTTRGALVTLVPSAGTVLTNAAALASPYSGLPPANGSSSDPLSSGPSDNVTFPDGLFQFTIQGVSPGGATTVEMILPVTMGLDPSMATFYKFGPTPQNHTPHWYQFLYHQQTDTDDASTTGAQFLDSTHILLHFVDGQRGDDDLTANGVIVDPGGPAIRLLVVVQVPGGPPPTGDGTNRGSLPAPENTQGGIAAPQLLVGTGAEAINPAITILGITLATQASDTVPPNVTAIASLTSSLSPRNLTAAETRPANLGLDTNTSSGGGDNELLSDSEDLWNWPFAPQPLWLTAPAQPESEVPASDVGVAPAAAGGLLDAAATFEPPSAGWRQACDAWFANPDAARAVGGEEPGLLDELPLVARPAVEPQGSATGLAILLASGGVLPWVMAEDHRKRKRGGNHLLRSSRA
jgi:hypothetical protein